AQPVGLAGLDNAREARSGERVVTDEVDGLHAGAVALDDVEDNIDAVVRKGRHDSVDLRTITAAARIVVFDSTYVALKPRIRQDAACLGLDDLDEDVCLNLLVALKDNRVDHRVLDNRHDQR